jgi:hypothetical protein
MQDLQPQRFLEAIEIPIPMQQLMPSLQTKSSDQAIDCLADRITAPAQLSVVLCGDQRQVAPASVKDLKSQKLALRPRKLNRVLNSLQYFTKNQVGQPHPMLRQVLVQPICFRVACTAKVVNPDGRVDDHHGTAYV